MPDMMPDDRRRRTVRLLLPRFAAALLLVASMAAAGARDGIDAPGGRAGVLGPSAGGPSLGAPEGGASLRGAPAREASRSSLAASPGSGRRRGINFQPSRNRPLNAALSGLRSASAAAPQGPAGAAAFQHGSSPMGGTVHLTPGCYRRVFGAGGRIAGAETAGSSPETAERR